jgi:hypothetical protein
MPGGVYNFNFQPVAKLVYSIMGKMSTEGRTKVSNECFSSSEKMKNNSIMGIRKWYNELWGANEHPGCEFIEKNTKRTQYREKVNR